eukprot:CAMPEP_0172387626 /NCGR_PEP_ID=MMETSP1061-20121228/4910_1 /TAXON_ID=37318 /ORGANISM="Pseudo-nitzschia pungens, Strain cf. pungens" /LENGTH=610 /DNA_ID=CAMNT_0013117323 /DNA_START=74 /DNA_END=1906 /DNA_ORIENTATION=-
MSRQSSCMRLAATLLLVQGMVQKDSSLAMAYTSRSQTMPSPGKRPAFGSASAPTPLTSTSTSTLTSTFTSTSTSTQLFATTRSQSQSRSQTRSSAKRVTAQQPQRRRPRTTRRQPLPEAYREVTDRYYYDTPIDADEEEEDDENDDDDDDEFLSFEVDSFQELQRSTGYEILDDQLQSQIDQASPTPNMFLDTHETDASFLEKVAMSSVPEQLPQPAVNAFRQQQQQQQTKTKTKRTTTKASKRSDLEFSSAQTVSPEEEIELAKMIQRGVWLHKLKTDREASESRSLTKSEWARLANLETATQLRREVATYRRAKQLLVSANMGLVHTVVKKHYYDVRKRSGVTYEELVQEGSLGLLRAAELFDPSRGIRFSTYATIWIKGHLSNSHALDGAMKVPAVEKQKWKKILKAHRELVQEKGGSIGSSGSMSMSMSMNHEATGLSSLSSSSSSSLSSSSSTVSVEEIANRLDMKVEDVILSQRKMRQAKSVLSLDYEYQQQSRGGSDQSSTGGQLLADMDDTSIRADAHLAERTQMQADVIAAMARNLTPREARLMRLRYGLTTDGKTRTIQECADAMGVSQARASQLAKACLLKLREAAEADSLEEYLLTIA